MCSKLCPVSVYYIRIANKKQETKSLVRSSHLNVHGREKESKGDEKYREGRQGTSWCQDLNDPQKVQHQLFLGRPGNPEIQAAPR